MLSIINNLDQELLFFIQTLHNPLLDQLMIFFTILGNKGFIWIVFSMFLLINKKTRLIGFMTLFALALSTILGEGLLKYLIQRPRPYTDFPGIQLLIKESTIYSFPSGHTTSSFAAAYVLCKNLKKHSLLLMGMASMIAFSRVYLFMHYPSDILAGIILGMICAKIVIYIFKKNNYIFSDKFKIGSF